MFEDYKVVTKSVEFGKDNAETLEDDVLEQDVHLNL